MSEAAAEKNACTAQLAGGGFECARCALAWDDGDGEPMCSPLTFARMRAAAIAEAERIEASQDALTADTPSSPPLRRFRFQPQLKRAMEFRALARLIDRITADQVILDRLAGRRTETAA